MTPDRVTSGPGTFPTPQAAPSPAPRVRIRDVCHTFGEGESSDMVLKNNNLDLYPGEIVIMTGQSGSGKTTLLTLIGGLRRLQQGSLQVLGMELLNMAPANYTRIRRGIGFIFQAHNLFGSLTALQNVRLALELGADAGGGAATRPPTDKELDDRAAGLLTELGLGHRLHYKPQNLSGGQRQRVAIARALACEPELILADEPTAALDAQSAEIVVQLFKRRAEERNCTIIIVTHDSKILEAAHRIVYMKYGEIISNIDMRRAKEICRFLKDSAALIDLVPGTLTELDFTIANTMADESFRRGGVIIRQNEPGDKFYVIRKGEVIVSRDPGDGPCQVAELGKGQFFGEVALVRNEPRNATVIAKSDVELFSLTKQEFHDILKERTDFEQQIRQVLLSRL